MLILFTLCFHQHITAQTGGFTVDTIIGCAPLTIQLTDTSTYDPAITRSYYYKLRPGLPPVAQDGNPLLATTFTYTDPGTYSIGQFMSLPAGGQIVFEAVNIVKVVAPVTPTFTVSNCPNREVTIQAQDTTYTELWIDWGDGSVSTIGNTASATHNYATDGSYTLQVLGGFAAGGGTCGDSTFTIQATQNIPAAVINSASQDQFGAITINYTLPNVTTYQLQEKIGSNSYQTISTLATGSSSTILSSKNVNDTLCYRIVAEGSCLSGTISSNEACFLANSSVTSSSTGISINWEIYQGPDFSSYALLKDGTQIGIFSNITQANFNDAAVTCQQNYCYEMRISLSDGTLITQYLGCAIAISSGMPIEASNFTVSSSDGLSTLNWDINSTAQPKSTLLFITSGGDTDSVEISGTSYTDTQTDANNRIACYQLKIIDSCDNETTSILTCNILLTGRKQGGDNLLNWQIPINLTGFDIWVLEKLDQSGNIESEFALSSTDTEFTELFGNLTGQVATYRLRVTDSGRGLTVYSNKATIIESLEVKVPDAFTPDNDGLNDNMEVIGNYIASIQIKVFDRWGQEIFQSASLDSLWDGQFQGKNMPQGVYTYLITGNDTFGNAFTKKGTILLLRK